MNAIKTAALTSALSLALASCSGGGGTRSPVAAVPNAAGSGPNWSTASIPSSLLLKSWNKGALTGAQYVGPATNASLSVTVLVHQQNATALAQYAQDVSNPASANFRHFLTPVEIGQRFGASISDYTAVAKYFAAQGLAVAGWPQRMVLTVGGSQTNLQRAFGTTFGVYQNGAKQFIAPTTAPHFQQALNIDAVGQLAQFNPAHTYFIPVPRAGASFGVGYRPQQLAAVFDYTGAYKAGYNGSGITIGIIGTGPIDVGGAASGDLDLDSFASQTKATVAHVTEVPVTNAGIQAGLTKAQIPYINFPYSGNFQTPPPVTQPTCSGSLPACNPEDTEAQLDTQQAASLAPGSQVRFYLAYNASDCTTTTYPNPCPTGSGAPQIGINETDAEIQQAIADNTADVISMSFGSGEPQTFSSTYPYQGSFYQLEMEALATEGIAVFVSSGDDGSAECYTGNTYEAQQCVDYPGSDWNATSVGGITAAVDGGGNPLSPFVAWGITTSEGGYGGSGGSGGGTSTLITAPPYQASAIGATLREQPDLALIGDPNTGVAVMTNVQWGGTLSEIGGTSVAAPDMAAMWALVLNACKQNPGHGVCPSSSSSSTSNNGAYWRLGNANPYIYGIYKHSNIGGTTAGSAAMLPYLQYNQVFDDIVYGNNQMTNPSAPTGTATPIPGYSAGTGYDEVTGVGVPYAGHLINALTGLSVL